MKKTIGRNEKCPCGSGKKYKKCCIGSENTLGNNNDRNEVLTIFTKYNSIDLIQTFAGLSLLPQNHGKYVRFEELTMQSLARLNQKASPVPQEELQSYLKKYYHSHHLEDPETNLFTDLVTFQGGDYLIFPGISEGGSYVLSNLLTAIYKWPHSAISDQLRDNCYEASILILNLSNIIASRLGYSRYMDSLVEEDEIFHPSHAQLKELKTAIVIPEEEMVQLLKESQISKEVLQKFLHEIDSQTILKESSDESPLVINPIIYSNGEYIIASPATMSYALVNFILTEARSLDCISDLSMSYHDYIWNNLQLHLRQLGCTPLELSTDINIDETELREGIYRFDNDKLVYVQLITGGEGQYQDRKQSIIDRVLTQPVFLGHKFMDITLVSSMGREVYFLFEKTNNSRSIGMPIYDFVTLANLREHSAIDLWKCVIASEERISDAIHLTCSFLDIFKLYKENDDSFYLSDNVKNAQPFILPGYAGNYYQESKLLLDEHSVLRFEGGKLVHMPVVRKDKYEPVYYSNIDLGRQLRLLVEGFDQPIWVEPLKSIMHVAPEASGVYFKMAEAIAFWLWQSQAFIKNDLSLLGRPPIYVFFEFVPEDSFYPIVRDLEKDPLLSEHFEVISNGRELSISIPHTIIPYLNGADNEGERVLLRHILKGLNQILAAKHHSIINDERIDTIIEETAPLGIKKKVFFVDTASNLMLDPSNLDELRYIQDYDINQVLDCLVPDLGALCPSLGNKLDKEAKEKLTRDIVLRVLLPKLESIISTYENEALLQRLFSLNESLIQKREELKILTPTRIACFSSFEDQIVELHESLDKLNQTIIAVRCLIEHLAAEPSLGQEIVSTTAIDNLIAIMSAIIDWGSLGDQIKFELFEIEMEILPSGRVGTKKEIFKEVFDPYSSSKARETVTDALDSFAQAFQQDSSEGEDVPENLDRAFIDEFGISFTRICEIINDMGIIAYQQSNAYACISRNELFLEINKLDHIFTEEEFDTALLYLCLINRGKVQNVPAGFDNIDISPWRFNRRLSLYRKPIVALDNPDDPSNPIIYWGYRQLLASRIYLYDQCITNRLRVADNGPIEKVLGKIAQHKGKKLVESVIQELGYKNLIIDSEVEIRPNSTLFHEKDIGDVDVIIIDKSATTIYSLECKSLAPSRNIKEMIEEVGKLFGSDNKKGMLDKHLERDLWLKDNLDLLGAKYKLDLSGYKVSSFFITQEDMLTPYLKNRHIPIPMITLYDLKERGLDALK